MEGREESSKNPTRDRALPDAHAHELRIDFGTRGIRTSSAQVVKHYEKEDLLGKLVLAVVNFPPRQIADFFSEVLALGVMLGEGDILLVHSDRDVPLGTPVR